MLFDVESECRLMCVDRGVMCVEMLLWGLLSKRSW